MATGYIVVNEELCKGCELCTTVCPKSVLTMADDRFTPKGYHPVELVDPDKLCTGCAICSVICPDAAITVYRYVPAEKAAVS
ncbi:MAG: 4Fe-4S binding protein [Anaerolineales bacterium]|jgi:2-oxoglutarate ferredoxin oxidoreductase subunit delta